MIIIGLDDTDTLESRGTGHLARTIAAELSAEYQVYGVTRHQLLMHPRIPYTKNNSSAAITLEAKSPAQLVFNRVRSLMLQDYQVGSDPGLCVAEAVPQVVTAFGQKVKAQVVSMQETLNLAAEYNILLAGLGGNQQGVIGALAAVGLAAGGEDGRYIQVGDIRDLSGLQPVHALLAAGVAEVRTIEGDPIKEGIVLVEKLRPARRGKRPVAIVEHYGEHWRVLKLD